MEIQELELKNFGKFKEEKIQLQDGIQLFYGENEAGKSTIHTFIKSMLFGMERGRGRASVNDTFSRYEPWENPGYYAGAMTFVCGSKRFRLERHFDKYKKGAKLICLDDGEELSVADGDLEMLLSGLDSSGYEDTFYIGQLRAKTGQTLADELKNYATNYYVAGDSEIDLAAAQNALLIRRKELDREEKNMMAQRQSRREKIEQEASYVWRDIHRLEEELKDVEEAIVHREKREREKKEAQSKENKGVIDELRPPKWRIHPIEIVLIVAAIIVAFLFVPKPWNSFLTIILTLLCGIYVWNRLKESKKKAKTPPELILEEITPEEEKISKEKLLWEQTHIENELKEKQVQYENVQEQLEELAELAEDYKEHDKKRMAVTMAMKRLEELSADMQNHLTRELNQKASAIIEEITEGKYSCLLVDEELHMSLMKDECKIEMEQISQGTLEQIYFALRMAVGQTIHEEPYPIILDDTFAFYDDVRLENTLKWLAKQKNQIIIFSCQKREEKILKKLNIPYNKKILC